VFFVNLATQQLQPEFRYVASPAPQTPAPLTSVIAAMLAGPNNTESSDVYSAIPSDVSVISTTQAPGNVVIVNMNNPFAAVPGVDSELAAGQIVATVAAEKGPGTGVLFEIEGERTSVLIANGSEAAGPVYLLDFVGGPASP
jgi:spore germination protein GerM